MLFPLKMYQLLFHFFHELCRRCANQLLSELAQCIFRTTMKQPQFQIKYWHKAGWAIFKEREMRIGSAQGKQHIISAGGNGDTGVSQSFVFGKLWIIFTLLQMSDVSLSVSSASLPLFSTRPAGATGSLGSAFWGKASQEELLVACH